MSDILTQRAYRAYPARTYVAVSGFSRLQRTAERGRGLFREGGSDRKNGIRYRRFHLNPYTQDDAMCMWNDERVSDCFVGGFSTNGQVSAELTAISNLQYCFNKGAHLNTQAHTPPLLVPCNSPPPLVHQELEVLFFAPSWSCSPSPNSNP